MSPPPIVGYVAGLAALLLGLGAPPLNSATAKPVAIGRRILLVGVDGADWLVMDSLVAAGRLPVFGRLKARGRTGIMLATPPLLSPILWTTIATGRRPEDHRILDFMLDLPAGGQEPVPSTERQVAALWNIFSAAGRRVGVVGWWASWPAEDVRGTIVSDRVAPQLVRPTAELDPDAISPHAQAAALGRFLVRARELDRKDLSAYVPLTVAEFERARRALEAGGSVLYEDALAHLAAIVASTRTYGAMAEKLVADGQPDLLLVYLEIIDSVSHRFVKDGQRGPSAIERAYRDADELIARLAARSAPDTWVVVCSDHGFQPANAAIPDDPADLTGPATAWHRPYGIVAAAEARELVGSDLGRPLRPVDAGTITPLDIAPTLLHAAGLPVSMEMPGRVVAALLPQEAAARSVERVATLEPARRLRPAGVARTADPDVLARLKALGYVGSSSTTTSLARQNLGEIFYRAGRLPEAERELRAVLEAQPGNLTALLWLAKVVRDLGRAQAALALYERALPLPGVTDDIVVEAVELAASSGLVADARRLTSSLKGSIRTSPGASVARAILAQAEAKTELAERELRAAVAADPLYFPALSRLCDLLLVAGRAREALPLLTRATDTAPGSPRHQALLGVVLLASGDATGAEARLSRALRLAPDGASVRIDLGRAQLSLGKTDMALATLASAPASVERSMLLGAGHSRKGQWAEAATHYRAALDTGLSTPELLNGLAWAQLKLGRSAEAVELLNRSLALERNQPEISRLLAEISRPARR